MNLGRCGRCDRTIRWVVTTNNRPMPLDSEPNPRGNVVIHHTDPDGTEHVHVLARDADTTLPRFMPHAATCGRR